MSLSMPSEASCVCSCAGEEAAPAEEAAGEEAKEGEDEESKKAAAAKKAGGAAGGAKAGAAGAAGAKGAAATGDALIEKKEALKKAVSVANGEVSDSLLTFHSFSSSHACIHACAAFLVRMVRSHPILPHMLWSPFSESHARVEGS